MVDLLKIEEQFKLYRENPSKLRPYQNRVVLGGDKLVQGDYKDGFIYLEEFGEDRLRVVLLYDEYRILPLRKVKESGCSILTTISARFGMKESFNTEEIALNRGMAIFYINDVDYEEIVYALNSAEELANTIYYLNSTLYSGSLNLDSVFEEDSVSLSKKV